MKPNTKPGRKKVFFFMSLVIIPLLPVLSPFSEISKNKCGKETKHGKAKSFAIKLKGNYPFLIYILEKRGFNENFNDTECGDCQNPLVQVMPLQIGGDIPEFDDYVGWESIKNGLRDFPDDYYRGMAFAVGFKQNNPCADIYYEMDSFKGDIHAGPLGEAKYEVRSWAYIEKASGGEKTLVKQTYQDQDEVSYQLVPILGRIQISHDLIALKNNQNYDSGTQILDWIADPPSEDYTFFHAAGESASIDGQIHIGSDGIITGEFSSISISGAEILFDNGDIGKTIRRKETPVSFNIQIDDHSKYPPYYLIKVNNIKNVSGEILPDNVRIALKARHGDILGGEDSFEWKIFNTTGGKLEETVLYMPPSCEVAQSDILEYAGVCEFNDFPPYIMEKRYEKIIPVKCEDFNGTIMYQRQVHWEDEAKSTYSTVFKKVDVVENASINVAAKYLRTVTDTQGSSELFEAKPLSGNFSATVTKVTIVTDHHGDWTKTVETWQGDRMMDPESGSNILLTIEPQKKNYIIQAEIRFPEIEGNTEYTTSGGAHWTTDTEPWGLNASFGDEGQTDGNSVNGHWSQPATGPILVLPQSGFTPGASWNWSMNRKNKK